MKGDPLPLDSFSFWVHGAPVPKGRPRFSRHAYTPTRTREWEKQIQAAAMAARPEKWPMKALYQLRVAVYRARRSGDADNFYKAAADAIQGVAFDSDSRIVNIHILMEDDPEDPRLYVEVIALPVPKRKRAA